MKQAQWLSHFETGIFAALDQKRDELIASGKKVYNLSIGTPDFQPAPHIMEAMTEACKKPENYVYALKDMNETLAAVKDYYKKRF